MTSRCLAQHYCETSRPGRCLACGALQGDPVATAQYVETRVVAAIKRSPLQAISLDAARGAGQERGGAARAAGCVPARRDLPGLPADAVPGRDRGSTRGEAGVKWAAAGSNGGGHGSGGTKDVQVGVQTCRHWIARHVLVGGGGVRDQLAARRTT